MCDCEICDVLSFWVCKLTMNTIHKLYKYQEVTNLYIVLVVAVSLVSIFYFCVCIFQENLPPHIPSSIPFLGQAISFGQNPIEFLLAAYQKVCFDVKWLTVKIFSSRHVSQGPGVIRCLITLTSVSYIFKSIQNSIIFWEWIFAFSLFKSIVFRSIGFCVPNS